MKKSKLTLIIALLAIHTILSQEVSTIASIPTNYGDSMVMTPDGDILVSGGFNKDNILKITPEGEVTEHVSGLPGPVGMGFDTDGNLYVANYTGNSISKITPDGTITNFASGLDGPAGLIVTQTNEIFVTLFGASFSGLGSTVLKFDLDGSSEVYAFGEGILDAIGITIDESQDLFTTNFVGGDVFKVDTSGNVETIANVPGTQINQIVYSNNYVFIPSPNLRKIYRVNTINGTVEHFAGSGGSSTTDGDLLEAEFNFPNSCTINASGDILYILDGQVGLIRAIDLSTLGVSDLNPVTFKLYPNPAQNRINLEGNLTDIDRIQLYNSSGTFIKEIPVNDQLSFIDTSSLSSGTYLIVVNTNQGDYSLKFIVE